MKFLLFIILFSIIYPITAQESLYKKFKALSRPEKCWVVWHPFIAKKTNQISLEARKLANEELKDSLLDGDGNGGQVDAFRHSLWMAMLVREIRIKAAKKLGNAHEKGNYLDYKKHRTEDGTLPDAQSCQMDFLNNDAGIQIGISLKNETLDSLKTYIKNEIITGKLWIIKKDKNGNFINCTGSILKSEDYLGKWENEKCIVSSDFRKKTINNQ
ncbi:MAG: hypothetical protein A2046_12090 [Bacteroidetes bacterium GWA2_30_7]|nr:MAG: hypothetical protein A2046_12090 [Bacteroidetes bacterium GWA2_30_7]